jgi:photosystem II stability/assembly factor-like uncharacterized protein
MTANAEDEPMNQAVPALAAAADFTGNGTVFAATMSGLYRSPDKGRSWEVVEIVGQNVPLFSLAISPAFADDGLLLVGAVEGGILRGTDGGAHWSLANFGGRQPHCAALALSPEFRQDGTAFAGTMSDGVFQSRTRGEHWEARNFGLHDLNVLALAVSPDFAQDETLYAATPTGLFRSPNAARAWREVPSPAAEAPVQCLAISAASPGTLFAGTDGKGIFRSDDRGATWRQAGKELADACINALANSADGTGRNLLFALTDSELYLSRDDAEHWERCAEVGEALCIAVTSNFSSGGAILVGLVEGGIARSSDLSQWEMTPVVAKAVP